MAKGNRKKSKKKWFVFGALGLLLLIVVLLVVFSGDKEKIVPVQTEKVIKRNITQIVSANGTIDPVEKVELRPEVTGEIVELPVKEGDKVNKGQLLIRLKPDQYIEVDDQCQYRNYADIKDSKIPPPDAIQHKIKLVDKKHIPLPLLNSAMNMYEDGQDLDVYLSALEVAKDRHFKKIFRCFILSFLCDLTQLVHYRGKIIATVQSILGRIDGASLPISSITFTALALESDQYFFEKARFYSWSYKEENAVKKLWLDLMHSAFLPGENKKIDITKLRSFREFLFRLQERSEGPEPGCINCEAKCNYKTEVEEILELEPYLLNDFTSAINRKDNVPSTAAAEFSKYLTESFASQYNADIAYCLLNHLTSMHQISTEGQLTMLFKARQHLLFPEKISEPE